MRASFIDVDSVNSAESNATKRRAAKQPEVKQRAAKKPADSSVDLVSDLSSRLTTSATVFDIETGPLPEDRLRSIYVEPTYEEFAAGCDQRWKEETKKAKYEEAIATGWQTFVDRAALSPLTGQVVAVGYFVDGELTSISGECHGGPEAEKTALSAFWTHYAHADRVGYSLVGFNSDSFDVPFLVRRSWLLDVPVPQSVIDPRGYANGKVFIDLMRRWGCGDRNGFISLDRLARAFGLSGKSVVDPTDPEGKRLLTGKDFARLWLSDDEVQVRAAIEYLESDLRLTWELGVRMGVI